MAQGHNKITFLRQFLPPQQVVKALKLQTYPQDTIKPLGVLK